jgi:hypothetical protein
VKWIYTQGGRETSDSKCLIETFVEITQKKKKKKRRGRRRKKRKRNVAKVCTYYWRRTKFLNLKFTSLCPLVLLVKVGWRQGRGLGSDEDEVLRYGVFEYAAKENVDLGGWILNLVIGGPMPTVACLYTTRDPTANSGKSAFSFLWVAHCKDRYLVKIRRRGNNL